MTRFLKLAPLALLLALPRAAGGAEAALPTPFEFRLEIFRKDKPAGEAVVRLAPRDGGGFLLTTRGSFDTGERMMPLSSELQLTPDLDWTRAESLFGAGDSPEMRSLADRLSPITGRIGTTEKGRPPRSRDIRVEGTSVVLENYVYGDYAALFARIPAGAIQVKGTIVVPSSQEELAGGATRRSLETGTLADQPIDVELWDVQAGNSITQVRRSLSVPGQILEVVPGKTGYVALRPGFRRGEMRVERPKVPRLDGVAETELTIEGRPGWAVPATLSLPAKRDGRIAAVVLIPGGGALDRDGTVERLAFGRDFAWGLAAEGIAVLRWEKRSRAHADRMMSTRQTLGTDLVEDAVAAVRIALARPEIDPARVYLAGHGLGGFALPEVLAKFPTLAGAILLGAPSRPIDVVAEAREEHLARAFGVPVSEAEKRRTALRAQFARIRSGDAKDGELSFGAPASWWRDLLGRKPAEQLAADPRPVIALRGTKDFESWPEDMALWREAARSAGKTNFRGGPVAGVNHHFVVPPYGTSDGRDYQADRRVDPQLFRMVSDWIRRGGKLATDEPD